MRTGRDTEKRVRNMESTRKLTKESTMKAKNWNTKYVLTSFFTRIHQSTHKKSLGIYIYEEFVQHSSMTYVGSIYFNLNFFEESFEKLQFSAPV